MEHHPLTPSQSAVLFVLMSQARDVPNPELRTLAPELTRPSRQKLNDLGLIESAKGPRNSYVHSLTDRGWAWCARELDETPPKGAQPPIRALYAVMAGIGRYLVADDLRLHEVFRPPASPPAAAPVPVTPPAPPTAPDDDVDRRIRAAYAQSARGPGAWVAMTTLRARLPDVEAGELDDALVRLQRRPGVSLIPQEDQMLLTDADRSAAVRVGTQLCHLFAIEDL
ncbi:MarR family transcriptional regulator [Gordonia sp. SL306]|uniref:MarR family transcriptional regulator n=1 Tax=Gordonia sp. SL306 TaxID=2995145 RepID=UPI00226E43B0|nr:MarR family transcriptional regulator [Gordonia sp. SL306]WAC56469.1 MarR family transcriptional regulator [Gordonia sp. SL306]